uniref:SET binding factor 2 n=1 Tax=Mus musculus TaxID=10090 RepID=E9Q4I8_MOUSE
MARLADYFIVVGYDHEKPVLSTWWMAPVQRAETANILCGGPNRY